ncbi:hypothetical protein [Kibdelosporangium aridum]|uniref:Uncharacterized protein n=1 Tax=Kibdelosporangium aridum TaxID=2030 RepID=A0A1Y5Y887_KIBAR|nr:hypothetical protein [Kibdelosporangium aridum]SMD26031.1 hypothetical protein SAMN05661093_09609 [Kibdelosporangium aridum]
MQERRQAVLLLAGGPRQQASQPQIGANADTLKAAGTPSISCPAVADRLPAVPDQARTEVDQNLRLLDKQIAEANQRLAREQNQRDPNFVNNAILGALRSKRVATLDRMAIAIGRNAPRPANLVSLADCDLSYGAHTGHGSTAEPAPKHPNRPR